MKLVVKKASRGDIYRDTIRIPELHRRDTTGRPIPEGRICKVTVAGKTRLVCIRGREDETGAVMYVDEITRNALGLVLEAEVDVQAVTKGLVGEWCWAWNASDPMVRASVQSNLVSVCLGALGALLGVVSMVMAFRPGPN